MRARLLYVSIPAFANMVREGGGWFRVTEGIAPDAKIVRFGYSPERDCMFVVVESPSYEEVLEGAEFPAGYVTVQYEDRREESAEEFKARTDALWEKNVSRSNNAT